MIRPLRLLGATEAVQKDVQKLEMYMPGLKRAFQHFEESLHPGRCSCCNFNILHDGHAWHVHFWLSYIFLMILLQSPCPPLHPKVAEGALHNPKIL